MIAALVSDIIHNPRLIPNPRKYLQQIRPWMISPSIEKLHIFVKSTNYSSE